MHIVEEQVAVITGAASGIGYGLAEALAARGVRLVLTDIRAEGLAKAETSLRDCGARVTAAVVDVSDPASVNELAERTDERYGRVDLVCNNAGVISPAAPLWEQTADTWQRMLNVKLLGVVHGVTAFAPLLIRQEAGHFLNTASAGGLAPLPDRTPYTAAMHAVVGLTETLDLELKRLSPALGATVLCPGLVDTPLAHNSAELGAVPLPARTGSPSMRSMAASRGGILSPREAAEAAITAIEAGRVHTAPGGSVTERARSRVGALLEDLAAQ